MSQSVTTVLEEAVEADPANVALRVHLASLLVLVGGPQRALTHARAALESAPGDIEVLGVARDAAGALGDTAKAKEYARLIGPIADEGLVCMTQPVRADVPSDADAFDAELERLHLTLADVGGLAEVRTKGSSCWRPPITHGTWTPRCGGQGAWTVPCSCSRPTRRDERRF